jgi:hypothetical protein
LDPIIGNIHQQYGSREPRYPNKKRSALVSFTTSLDKLLQGREAAIVVHGRVSPKARFDDLAIISIQCRRQ